MWPISRVRSARAASQANFDPTDGSKLVDLVFGSQEWIHRRVERIEILATGDCVRNQSIDFTLPARLSIPGSKGAVLVPVGILRKGPLSRFNLTGPDGRPIPLLETASNGRLAVEFLRTLASRTYGYAPEREPAGVEPALFRVVHEDSAFGDSAVSDLRLALQDESSEREVAKSSFLSVVSQFSQNFLMVVELDERQVDRRSILKFSYLEPRNDPHSDARYQLDWSLDDFGSSASFHFEFEPPPLLGIAQMTLIESVADEMMDPIHQSPASPINIGHFAVRPSDRLSTAIVTVELVPKRYGIAVISHTATALAAVMLAAIVVVRFIRHLVFGPVPVGSTAASMLLAGGGILLTWIARTPEDWMIAKVLRQPRRYLAASAITLLLAGCLMALPVAEPVRTGLWIALMLFAITVFFRSALYRRRSRTHVSTS